MNVDLMTATAKFTARRHTRDVRVAVGGDFHSAPAPTVWQEIAYYVDKHLYGLELCSATTIGFAAVRWYIGA